MLRNEIRAKIWQGTDPYYGFPSVTYQSDTQGWGSQHEYLMDSIPESGECVIVEVGVWKGASTLRMAAEIKDRNIDGCVIAVDTWLGAVDHWVKKEMFDELGMEFGYPTLQRKFLKNVLDADLAEFVVPLPLDSTNASSLLYNKGINADIIHLDAGHEYFSVINDIQVWWERLKPGGVLIGDDYHLHGAWLGVRKAFDEFFGQRSLALESSNGKCRVTKPT